MRKASSSLLLSEYSCDEGIVPELAVSGKIEELFNKQQNSHPQHFFSIEQRSYNYENPLIISLEGMKKDYQQILNDPQIESRSADLFYLFNHSQRFESQRCQFASLIEKKRFDLRPYLNITHACYKKYQSTSCDDSEYKNMEQDKESWTKTNAINLCLSFSKSISCHKEFSAHLRKNTLGSMIRKYQDRFQTERYEPLFKLRPIHNKYSCTQTADQVTMVLKVYGPGYDSTYLRYLLDEVETTWKSDKFSLKLLQVDTGESDAILIQPTTKAVSYVPDDNNRIVYLSSLQDFETSKRILAHEFGHVLGFPDCYIEFFDDMKKELVYYEISKNYKNIMCSLKNGVQVPEDYFAQLAQNSCIFN